MAKFAPLKTRFDDAIWNQDLSGPFSVFNLYVQRAVERMTYARGLLVKGFDFSTDESYTFDRKDAALPKDQAELDDLWRKRTMNDWLRLKLAGKPDADIRKTLDKRYANYIERVRQLDGADAFQSFMTAYAETHRSAHRLPRPARGGELRHCHEAVAGRHRRAAAGARRLHRHLRPWCRVARR